MELTNSPAALIIKGPGTNCDVETQYACAKVGFQATIVHISQLLAQPDRLQRTSLVVVPGGFSYGDDLGAGTVMANELLKIQDPLRDYVRTGGLLLGICNGFQILTRAGLLPDPMSGEPQVTLALNESRKFEDRWVYLRIVSPKSVFLPQGSVVELPVAHAEGRFIPKDPRVMDQLLKNAQVILRYVGPEGGPASYPWNPSGSVEGVAGICDASGHVMGLMPHPERFIDPCQHPQWTRYKGRYKEGHGLQFFRNAFEYCKGSPR
jgi:phosphoribosylformylglycinamidine synthase